MRARESEEDMRKKCVLDTDTKFVFVFFGTFFGKKIWDAFILVYKKKGRERVLLSLFVANKKYLWKYLTKGKKEEKKHPFKEENILSLFSLFKGRQGFLSPPSSSSSTSCVFVKYRAAREERKQRAARGRKNPDIWWREEVLLGVLLIERSLCLRAFSPSNFHILSTIFSSFWWENCPSETFLFSLWFFFLSFRKEKGTKRGNQHKKLLRREYVERRRLSLRNTLLQKEGRIDLERFFLVENFQRRGERKFALRRVERKREREKGDFNFF